MHLSLSTVLWVGAGWVVAAAGALAVSAAAGRAARSAPPYAPLSDAEADALRAHVRDRVLRREVVSDASMAADPASDDDGPEPRIDGRHRPDDHDRRAAM